MTSKMENGRRRWDTVPDEAFAPPTSLREGRPPAGAWWDRREDVEANIFPYQYNGEKVFRIKFNKAVQDINDEGALDTDSFEVTVTGGTAPTIADVDDLGGNEYEITLNSPIVEGQWTTIRALVEDTGDRAIRSNPWDRIDLGFLPGDVDGNQTTEQDDVTALETLLANSVCDLERMDMDRSGTCSSTDVTRLEQLLAGTGTTQVWEDVSLPARP